MMKNRLRCSFLGKAMSGLLVILLIICAVWAMDVNGIQVEAATETLDYIVEPRTDIADYRTKDANGNFPIPTCQSEGEWVFAGWFKNQACTTAFGTSEKPVTGTTYYAKFVSAEVLSVKCQITSGTTESSSDTILRCLSSVDSLAYKNIGFDLETPTEGTKYYTNSKVGTRVKAKEGTDTYAYSPKVFDTESEYFYSAIETIKQENFNKEYIVKPYWTTKDGTKVYGVSRYVMVSEAINKNVIYISVKASAALDKNKTTNLTADGVTLEYQDYDADTGYAFFALSVENTSSLPSATAYTIAGTYNGETINTNYVYRNLNTKFEGEDADVDNSWYHEYLSAYPDEDEFVIATSADLYGFASLVNSGSYPFEEKTVYMVSDIEVNKGYADHETSVWDTSKDATGTAFTTGKTGTSYEWPVIGTGSGSYRFRGTFDGQKHTISGIYMNSSTLKRQGLFADVYTNVTLKNFRLVNSYFNMQGVTDTSSVRGYGSIVGYMWGGNVDGVYSDAIVINGGHRTGGLIGCVGNNGDGHSNFRMNNCQFNGTVSINPDITINQDVSAYLGGLIGAIGTANKTTYTQTITNCLNTGKISALFTENSDALKHGIRVGGLFGIDFCGDNTLVLSHCLSAGDIESNVNPNVLYMIQKIGGLNYQTQNCKYFYSTLQTEGAGFIGGDDDGSDYEESSKFVDEATISGDDALTECVKRLFTYVTNDTTYANESYWAIVPGEHPVLSSFAGIVKEEYQPIDTSWYRNNVSSFTLKDAADFYGFSLLVRDPNAGANQFEGKTVSLGANIAIPNEGSASNWDTEAPAYGWLSIGSNGNRFNGTFNGNGYEISGVYLNTTENETGLFGFTLDKANIKNFRLINSYFESTGNSFGSIVGRAAGGKFDSIYSDAIVTADGYYVGGLIGNMQSSSADFAMNNCWFNGKVTSSNGKYYLGGLIGYLMNNGSKDRTITNCLNTGIVYAQASATQYVGGLIGYNTGGAGLTMTNCLNAKEISYNSNVVNTEALAIEKGYGLIAGSLDETTELTGVYTIAQAVLKDVATGKDLGNQGDAWVEGPDEAGVPDVTNGVELALSRISSTNAIHFAADMLAYKDGTGQYKNYWVVTTGTPVLASFTKYVDSSIKMLQYDTSWYKDSATSFSLSDTADLYGFALLSKVKGTNEFKDKTVTLKKLITISTRPASEWATTPQTFPWPGIGGEYTPFSGTFDGNNYNINGIYMNTDTRYTGFFNYTRATAVVKNFRLINSYFTSTANYLGSVAGLGRGIYEKIYSDAIVVGEKSGIGGIIGRAYDANGASTSMSTCWFDGTVTNNGDGIDERFTGGLVGMLQCHSTISYCLNTGAVSAPNYTTQEGNDVVIDGEEVVAEEGETPDTETETDTSVRPYIGGLFGFFGLKSTLNIDHCLNTGKVTYNEAATVGYGAILGRANIESKIVSGGDVYATTSSCSAFVSAHATVESNLAPLDAHIVDSGLEQFFEDSEGWTPVDGEAPILSYFADLETVKERPLQGGTTTDFATLIKSAQASSAYLGANVAEYDVELSASDYTISQGGCSDGEHYYMAWFSQYNGAGNDNNRVVIEKYSLTTGEKVRTSVEFYADTDTRLWHANDITYNEKLHLLVIACGTGKTDKVVFINPDDLSWVGHKVLDVGIFSIDYNADYNCYITQTADTHYSYILNGDMEIIAKYENATCDPQQTTSGAAQGAACDNNYIYYLFSGGSLNEYMHTITVFDWNGNYVTEIQFTQSEVEPESITVQDGMVYYNINGSSTLYKLQEYTQQQP